MDIIEWLEENKIMLQNVDRKEVQQRFDNLIDKLQQEAFMDGYHYAIKILEENITKKK